MFGRAAAVPDGVPVLSAGRHRNPRKGACFMEMASFLAGERWSDHPKCTHPVLATLARCVNDCLDDQTRQALAVMIPEVVGLNPDDPRTPATLVLTAASAALPIAPAERQNVMALAILAAERNLAELEGRPVDALRPSSKAALSTAPLAERWAREFASRSGLPHPRRFSSPAASSVVALAVDGIARACIDDTETRLVSLLERDIEQTRRLMPAEPSTPAVSTRPRDNGRTSSFSEG